MAAVEASMRRCWNCFPGELLAAVVVWTVIAVALVLGAFGVAAVAAGVGAVEAIFGAVVAAAVVVVIAVPLVAG